MVSSPIVTFTITVPAGNDRGPLYAEQLLAALLANGHRRGLRLAVASSRDGVTLRATVPDQLAATFRRQCTASYPDCRIEVVYDGEPKRLQRRTLRLSPSHATLRTWRDFRDDENRTIADPLAGLLSATSAGRAGGRLVLDIRGQPLWKRRDGRARVRLAVAVDRDARRPRRCLDELIAALGRFTGEESRFRRAWWPWTMLRLSTEQLATLWHAPLATARTERLAISPWRELEPPAFLPTPKNTSGLAILGRTAFRGRRETFGIAPDDRLRHVFLTGKTGMGKSTLMRNLVTSDVTAGHGCCLIDPHGDLAENVLTAIPRQRRSDVVSFDAGDQTNPPRFNPLQCRDPRQRPLVASGVIAAFKKIHADSWGPRLEHILRNGLFALLEQPHATLGDLQRLLGDTHFRRSAVSRLRDPVVRSFFTEEFGRWNPRFRAEAIAPVQNKIGAFLASPILRAIVDAPGKGLDLRRIMDRGQVLVVNLSKGRVGEDGSALLGALLVNALQLAAMSRADTPEAKRHPFYLYVDEFQNVATESFATILSEARKYGLGLTVANQFLEQIEDGTLAALFGNVGTIVAFQVGARDGETLAEQLGGHVEPSDLLNLPKYHAYVRLLVDGMPSRPFSMQTIPPR